MSHFTEKQMMPRPTFQSPEWEGMLIPECDERTETDRVARAIDAGITAYNETMGLNPLRLIDDFQTRMLKMLILGSLYPPLP